MEKGLRYQGFQKGLKGLKGLLIRSSAGYLEKPGLLRISLVRPSIYTSEMLIPLISESYRAFYRPVAFYVYGWEGPRLGRYFLHYAA